MVYWGIGLLVCSGIGAGQYVRNRRRSRDMKRHLTLLLLLFSAPIFTQSLPAWLYGEWDGIGQQSNTNTEWLTWMTLYRDDAVPAVDYPSLECSGQWELQRVEGKTWIFREVITKTVGRCSQHDWVYVRYHSEETLEVTYAHSWAPENIIATLTLRRRQLP